MLCLKRQVSGFFPNFLQIFSDYLMLTFFPALLASIVFHMVVIAFLLIPKLPAFLVKIVIRLLTSAKFRFVTFLLLFISVLLCFFSISDSLRAERRLQENTFDDDSRSWEAKSRADRNFYLGLFQVTLSLVLTLMIPFLRSYYETETKPKPIHPSKPEKKEN